MFSLLSIICLFAESATARPQVSTTLEARDDPSVLTSYKNYFGCDKGQKKVLQQAMKDAVMIAKFGLDYDPGGLSGNPGTQTDGPAHWYIDFSKQAALDYFGPRKANAQFQSMIFENMQAASQSYPGWGWSDWWNSRYISIACKPMTGYDGCNSPRSPNSPAYNDFAWFSQAPDGETRYPLIVFCGTFFKNLTSHAQVVKNVGDDKTKQGYLPNFRSQAVTFLHEILHVRQGSAQVCQGATACTDHTIELSNRELVTAYKPGRSKLLASMDVRAAAYNNDNYAYYALARWVESKYGNYPWFPTRWDKNKSEQENKDKDAGEPGAPEEVTLDDFMGGEVPADGPPSSGQPYPADYYPQYFQPVVEYTRDGPFPSIGQPPTDVLSPFYPNETDIQCSKAKTPAVVDCELAFSALIEYGGWAYYVPIAKAGATGLVGINGTCALTVDIGPKDWDFRCVPWFRDLALTFRAILDKCITPIGTIAGEVPFRKGDCTATLRMGSSNGYDASKLVVPGDGS